MVNLTLAKGFLTLRRRFCDKPMTQWTANTVISSHRVARKRAPMTGSAKQSRATAATGLLRRFAPRN